MKISQLIFKVFEIKYPLWFFLIIQWLSGRKKAKKTKFIDNQIQPINKDIVFIVDDIITIDDLLIAYKDIILIDIKVINIYKIPLSNQKSVSLRYVF